MNKQWWKINKDNIEFIKEQRDIKELQKFIKEVGKIYSIKPYKS
jgi:hypothetical protein